MSEVKFIDSSQEVIDTLRKLSKTALRKGGKIAGKKLKENTNVRSARLQNTVGQWPKIDKKTGQPELQIGYFSKWNTKRKGKKVSIANPAWLEFGIKPHTIKAGVLSSRGKVRSQTGKKILTDGKIDFGSIVQHTGFGGKNTLRNTVMNNINEIIKAQEETLVLLNGELEKAKDYIDESEDDELV